MSDVHTTEMQTRMFKALGIPEDEAQEKFGFLLEAFKYGVPPHGGLGIGLERLTMHLLGFKNVREATMFPRDINRVTP